ncbi:hypothetical protein LN037_28635 [Actinomycetospora sp. SF1]|nr:hypothetical protein [Actinomycetospora soli]
MGPPNVTHCDSRVRSAGLILSASAVVALAVVFDVLADEPPTHTLTVLLAAGTVGLGRLWLRGRAGQVFAAVNLVVIGQPAVHALTKLTHAGAEMSPHSHAVPESFFAIAIHVVIAVLVVAVAASEPLCVVIARAVLRALAILTRTEQPAGPPVLRLHRRERQNDSPHHRDLLLRQSLTRRGPPTSRARIV